MLGTYYRQLCLIRTCVSRILISTGQIGRSQSLPIHVTSIRIIHILPNPDRNLGYTSVRITQSCLYKLHSSWKQLIVNIQRLRCLSSTYSAGTKCLGIIHDRTPACHQFPGHGCTDGLTTERDLDSQATLAIDVFGLYFEMLSTGVCTTRHWQTTGRLVQELNDCTLFSRCSHDCIRLSMIYFRPKHKHATIIKNHLNPVPCWYSLDSL